MSTAARKKAAKEVDQIICWLAGYSAAASRQQIEGTVCGVPVPEAKKAEYRATADASHDRMMADPRMKQFGDTMPFDGRRMVFGGFEPLVVREAK